MKLWAIKWPSGWVDHRSLAGTRRDAWLNFDRENLNRTPAPPPQWVAGPVDCESWVYDGIPF